MKGAGRVIVLSLAVCGAALVLTTVAVGIGAAWPLTGPAADGFFPEWRYMVRPEREAALYHLFLALCFCLQTLAVYAFRKYL